MKTDVLIIGAGLSGSTAGRLLAEKGHKVLIVERLKHIAGHCYDYRDEYGITVHKYGPHIFHTNNEKVWKFINNFGVFHYYQHRVLSYAEGGVVPFPINRTTLSKIFGRPFSSAEAEEKLREEIVNSNFNSPPENFKDTIISQVGERLYNLFYKNYTLKQWNTEPENIAADVAKRIPIRTNDDDRYFTDKYQGVPQHGYTKLVESILNHDNISILLGEDYFKIKKDINADMVIYTGELDKYFNYKYGDLQYRSLDLKMINYEKEYFQNAAVVNYPNDYDWTRITEFKYFLDEKSERTTVCFEYPRAKGEPYYVVMTKENLKKRRLYLDEARKLEKTENIYFIGRLAEYKYYNMDQVIEAVTDKIDTIESG
ncbi:MAG: UDP-galactopyranose mutase [Spirochaetes bacterium]|nr:UDP-galactopyranose mutase [Spirochaetota bacterium]